MTSNKELDEVERDGRGWSGHYDSRMAKEKSKESVVLLYFENTEERSGSQGQPTSARGQRQKCY